MIPSLCRVTLLSLVAAALVATRPTQLQPRQLPSGIPEFVRKYGTKQDIKV